VGGGGRGGGEGGGGVEWILNWVPPFLKSRFLRQKKEFRSSPKGKTPLREGYWQKGGEKKGRKGGEASYAATWNCHGKIDTLGQ